MSRPRLTRQRFDALVSAMAYYETVIDDGEMCEHEVIDWRAERRHHESAMVWLRAMADQAGVR